MKKLCKNRQNSGITLIALVVTIISMVIMAGVSITALGGEDGIMTKAQIAKDKKTMADYEEKIKLEAIKAKSEMNLGGNIKENFINRLESMGLIVKTPEEDAGLEANQIKVITKDGYEFVYNISESADLELVSQAVNGKPYATVTLEQIALEGTANETIKIRATTSIEEGGQITKLECLETGVEKENPNTVEEFEVPGSGTYKFKATTKDGNTTTKKITIAINTVSNTITMTPSIATPRNTGEAGTQNGIAKGPIVLTINYGETELTKQYKKQGDTNWTNVPGTSTAINVTANESYVARYYDGTNGYNQETYNIVNVDNVAPTFTASNVVAIADGVNVTFTITSPATDEASEGASNTTAGILRYEYRLEDGTIGSTDSSTLTKTLTSSKLGDQKAYVKAIDKAGNETEVEKDVNVTVANTTITMEMTDPSDETKARNTTGSGTVNGVAQGPITLTINFGVTNLQKQYKVGEGSWITTNDNTVTLNDITQNGAIVAKYYDGVNSSDTQTYNIVNVDNENPTFTAQDVSVTVDDVNITATIDNEAQDTASTGAANNIAGILRYEYKLDDGSYQASSTLTATTMGNHIVYVKAIDKAGNETVIEKQTSVVADFSTIQMTLNSEAPRNTGEAGTQNGIAKGPLSLTINFGTTALQKQYKKYGDTNWITVNDSTVTINNITTNETYVAKYTDGTNSTEVQTYNVLNVDNIAPQFTASDVSTTVNDLQITVNIVNEAQDSASTGASNTTAGILRYEYSLDGINYSTNNVLTTTTWGNYTVYVKAIDKAGNQTVVQKGATVVADYSAIVMTPSTEAPRNTGATGTQNGINKGPISLTINFGTTALQKQYRIGTGSWVDVNNSTVTINNITTNGAYTARYYDGTRGTEVQTYNVVNVDNENPTFTSANVSTSVSGRTVTVTANATDTASTGASNTIAGILRYEYNLDGGTYQTSNTLTASSEGNHIVYVKAVDKAGNQTIVNKTINIDTTAGITLTNKNRTLAGTTSGYSSKNPVIPQGFKPVNTTNASWTYNSSYTEITGWNDGLVITDDSQGREDYGNEFVWVPCTSGNSTSELVSYSRKYYGGITSGCTESTDSITVNETTYNAIPYPEMPQITAYGGFWIARYEAGLEGTQTSNSSEVNNHYNSIPVSKKGTKIWNQIDYIHSYVAAQKMVNNSGVKSGLVTGKQWDTIMQWFENNAINVTNQNWGTYYNLAYSVNGPYFQLSYNDKKYSYDPSNWYNGSATHSTNSTYGPRYHGSGSNSNGYQKNIADLGGNVEEYTAESEGTYGNNVLRGGFSTSESSSYRKGGKVCGYDKGFRVVLYVLTDEQISIENAMLKNRTLAGTTTGYSSKNPVIPEGFRMLETSNASWTYTNSSNTEVSGWNNGLVITDDKFGREDYGNEFVWVPCTSGNATSELVSYSRKNYTGQSASDCNDATNVTTDPGDGITYSAMPYDDTSQIAKYGGFWVARYEAGLTGGQISNTYAINNNYDSIPVSKKGCRIWNGIDFTHSYVAAQRMINNTSKYGNTKSGLITGKQWDTIMQWYEKANIKVDNTQTWGTYDSFTYSITGRYFTFQSSNGKNGDWSYGNATHTANGYYSWMLHGSGLNSNGYQKNIADMGGNFFEWTSERYQSGWNFIMRGGTSGYQSQNGFAGYRNVVSYSNTSTNASFRVMLYIQ